MAKSAVGSALGFVTTVVTRVMAGTKQNEEAVLGLPEDTIKRLTDEFVQKLVNATQVAKNILTVVVDYSLSLPQMIAAGAYNYANPDITAEHLPLGDESMHGKTAETVTVELIHYGRDMETDAVLADLGSRGMRPATLPELCAIGAAYPFLLKSFSIAGSV